MARKVLFIGLVWPEPTSSAAGTRILQLASLFLANGDNVHFASAAMLTPFSFDLASIGIKKHHIELNKTSFNDFAKNLAPDLVVFDRFVTEEQFGWRLRHQCPNALTILDTEDLHFLRHARQQAIKSATAANLQNDTAIREIASIYRCDLSLIISKPEIAILAEQFGVPNHLLHYLPFLEEQVTDEKAAQWQNFNERTGFCFIGNFMHEPNWQTVLSLKNEVWPKLKKLIPNATLHIYGAYASQKAQQLHQPANGFFIMGRTPCARPTIGKHRVLLAPITFGAGAKGKLIDAMQSGTPSVTTSMGAEGMACGLPWNGFIEDDLELFCQQAKRLYLDIEIWQEAQKNGIAMINQNYAKTNFSTDFMAHLNSLTNDLEKYRNQNFIGKMLNHHHLQSAKYLSLWIEEKNKKASEI